MNSALGTGSRSSSRVLILVVNYTQFALAFEYFLVVGYLMGSREGGNPYILRGLSSTIKCLVIVHTATKHFLLPESPLDICGLLCSLKSNSIQFWRLGDPTIVMVVGIS